MDTLAGNGKWISGISKWSCHPGETEGHSGTHSLRMLGTVDDPSHAYVYFKIFDCPIAVYPDTVLSYWMKPLTAGSRYSGIDLTFADGTDLRSSEVRDSDGGGVHPANGRGVVGEWKQIKIPLGRYRAGSTITSIMFGYDSRPASGSFETLFDDLEIKSAQANIPTGVTIIPESGVYPDRVIVRLKTPVRTSIRYTLDGTTPNANSLLFDGTINLNRPGLWDLRFATQAADGTMSSWVFGKLYEVVK
jgi:hypothetical protein